MPVAIERGRAGEIGLTYDGERRKTLARRCCLSSVEIWVLALLGRRERRGRFSVRRGLTA